MPEWIEAVILGIVQGLTEFLPVSSSGHLEITKYILDDNSIAGQSMLTTVFLHFATALATIYVFRSDIIKLISGIFDKTDNNARSFTFYIIISMIPAVIVGLAFESQIENLFNRNMLLVGICLIVTAILLYVSERLSSGGKTLNTSRSLLVGIAQAVAILPGISRSGATISSSLLLGLDKEQAARFSFLMVVPLIFGKIFKDILSGAFVSDMPDLSYLLAGFVAAFLSGVWACKFMIRLVKASGLYWFAFYCFTIALIAIFVGLN